MPAHDSSMISHHGPEKLRPCVNLSQSCAESAAFWLQDARSKRPPFKKGNIRLIPYCHFLFRLQVRKGDQSCKGSIRYLYYYEKYGIIL